MLDEQKLKELDAWISFLEIQDSNFENYTKLMILKAARGDFDYRPGEPQPKQRVAELPPYTAGEYGDSEFLKVIRGKDLNAVFQVIDDLVDTIKVVRMSVYDGFIQKLKRVPPG